MNPLWVSSRFSHSKYNKTILLSDSAAYLMGYVASADTPKKQHTQKNAGIETGVQDGPCLRIKRTLLHKDINLTKTYL